MSLNASKQIMWMRRNESGHMVPPMGYPECGFDNEHCRISSELITGMAFLVVLFLIISWFVIR